MTKATVFLFKVNKLKYSQHHNFAEFLKDNWNHPHSGGIPITQEAIEEICKNKCTPMLCRNINACQQISPAWTVPKFA